MDSKSKVCTYLCTAYVLDYSNLIDFFKTIIMWFTYYLFIDWTNGVYQKRRAANGFGSYINENTAQKPTGEFYDPYV